jgi:mono/diheme cytochrome c family protein
MKTLGLALGLGLIFGTTLAGALRAADNSMMPPNGGTMMMMKGGRMPMSPAPTSGETSLQLAHSPKGSVKDPYIGDKQAIAQGQMLFSGAGCPGCHGGGGGGGICPPLIDGVWIYGGDNDTLFRLIALGSVDLQHQGYSRMAIENVVAPMPSFGSIIPEPKDILKIIAWIKSHYDANGKPLPGDQ